MTEGDRANELRQHFIDVLAHELRTPVTTIYAGARLLLTRRAGMSAEDIDELAFSMAAEADRLQGIVENLLVLARSERAHAPIDVEPLLLQHVLRRFIEREKASSVDARFSVALDDQLPMVMADEASLGLILRNLIANARKYAAGSPVAVAAHAEGEQVVVSVADRGPGIPADDLPHLFELFYRSPSQRSRVAGSGIGLFVARALSRAMGGELEAANRTGGGAQFTIRLPLADEPET